MKAERASRPHRPEEPEEEAGKISVAKEVIATIAGLAAAEVPGVYSPKGDPLPHGSAVQRYVHTELLGGRVRIALSVGVSYGRVLPEVAQELQEKVKTEVERLTTLPVEAVDVEVVGIVEPEGRA
ncbi:MAG: Asp23/Gls24 family envelope stress response protein [Candidatus Bipolaricaulota bacterium]|nr:Asp23/Gls24 family envelope stress response protein [Candidatus Bipolaricaulota bacterium]MCX7844657.1 Asp23/Gls24 family envelope stress response protein [Candidatus Bipolaricaulota bacterium]MDW8151316.1 Asp23/Gls24 family envelope stress response protein [Candidatus Bipolaricaulota bacterium]